MKFGVHVSAAGGADKAPDNAHQLGCETFQFFSRSPRGGQPPVLTDDIVRRFRDNCRRYGFSDCYIHTPYYINFASARANLRAGSAAIVRQELERGEKLGVTATMTHLGSAKDTPNKDVIPVVVRELIKMLSGYRGQNRFLIEIAAGSGHVIGATFDEVAAIIAGVEKKIKSHRIGVCFDTAHAFASGYDLRTPAAVKATLRQFDKIIGLDRLAVIHANDSKAAFNSRRDRHENIGRGEIGLAGWRALLDQPDLAQIDFILETPWADEKVVKKDLRTLQKLRHTE